MTTSAKAGIVQFSGDGFDTWKFRVETQLAAQGVRDIITVDPSASGVRRCEEGFPGEG